MTEGKAKGWLAVADSFKTLIEASEATTQALRDLRCKVGYLLEQEQEELCEQYDGRD